MDVFSNLMVIGECLLDGPRTRAFERAIAKVVRPDDTVVDVGTGSGILAMFSARAGAKRVVAIEIAPEIARFARSNVFGNGLSGTIEVLECDGRNLPVREPVDVVTMELMDTWLVAEQQAAALNSLHANGTIGAETKLLPYRYECLLELVNYDFSFYGFRMPFVIQARNFSAGKHVLRRFTEVHVANDLSFCAPLPLDVHRRLSLPVNDDGVCNAAVLTARTFLAPGVSIGSTSDMNMPVIVPLQPQPLRRGSEVSLEFSYAMGSGFGNFAMHWCDTISSHVAQPSRATACLGSRHEAHPRVEQRQQPH